MSTLKMMGMNTSRAQNSKPMAAAAAMTTSATLRSLTSIGAVVSGTSDARRNRSCARSGIGLLRCDGEAGATLQCFVDGHGGLCAFGGGDDDELHVARRIAGDEQAWNVCLAQLIRVHGAVGVHLAAKLRREFALLALAAREEDGVARRGRSVVEHDGAHLWPVVVDARDPRQANVDVLLRETRAIRPADGARAVGAEHDVRRPGFQRQREAGARGAAANHGDALVAMFPPVAVRAVMNGHAVADRKSTRLNSSHVSESRMPASA